MNADAFAISFHGNTTMPRIAQTIWPRRIVKYLGNSPVMSAPKGSEFAPKFVASTLRMKLNDTKKTPARAVEFQ